MKQKVLILISFILILSMIFFADNKVNIDLKIKGIAKKQSTAHYNYYKYQDNNIFIYQVKSSETLQNVYSEIKAGKLNEILMVHKLININNNKYQTDDYSYYVLTKDYLNGIIFTIEADEEIPVAIFKHKENMYFVLSDFEYLNNKFYEILNNIDIKNFQGNPVEGIQSDIIITANGDLGKDDSGWNYTIINKIGTNIGKASEKLENDNCIAVKIVLTNHLEELKNATIKVNAEYGGKKYQETGLNHFNLKPREVCEYSLLIPVDTADKQIISKIIDNFNIVLEYEDKEGLVTKKLK